MKGAKKIELVRLLSKRGVCSRSEAPQLILRNVVRVNSEVISDPAAWVSEQAVVYVSGVEIARKQESVLVALNKPRGYVTTRSDEQGRKTVYELLPDKFKSLKAVGRLDMATSGLLLFTNDTKLAARLTDPQNRVPRTYVAVLRGRVDEKSRKLLGSGIRDEGDFLRAEAVEIKKVSNKESTLIITLHEGKNREIRRLCKAIGHEVIKLKRISFGPIALEDLELGRTKQITFDPASIMGDEDR